MALFTGVHVLTHMSWLYSTCIIAFCLPKFPMQLQQHTVLFILFLFSLQHRFLVSVLRYKKCHRYTTILNFQPIDTKESKASDLQQEERGCTEFEAKNTKWGHLSQTVEKYQGQNNLRTTILLGLGLKYSVVLKSTSVPLGCAVPNLCRLVNGLVSFLRWHCGI